MNNPALHGAWWVWPLALVLYGLFRLWYDNWRGPLRIEEIDYFMQKSRSSSNALHTDEATLRKFLEEDDGKEFVMCNLVRLHSGLVPHPMTGVPTPARELMQEYGRHFVIQLLLRGGHPVMASRKIAGYIDAWNAPPDEGWSIAGMMRYRSRRDMMLLATQERFVRAHPFKIAAVDKTFSFPTQVIAEMVLRPRGVVALVLLLAAALVHLASLLV
jgi:hypothetical protein